MREGGAGENGRRGEKLGRSKVGDGRWF